MVDIRNKVMKDDVFKNEIDFCIKFVIDLFGSLFGRLSWKGKQINIYEVVFEIEIDVLFDIFKNFELNFDKKNM